MPILTLAGIFFLNFLARFIWGPLLPTIEDDLGISHAQGGALFFMTNLGYFSGLFASGHISSRLNHHKTIVISCLTCALALFASMIAPTLPLLMAALALIGFTAGLYLPSGIASMTYRLAPRDFGKAFPFHEISPSLGFIAGPLLAEALLSRGTWRGVLWPVALALVIAGGLYFFKPSTGDYKGDPPTAGNLIGIMKRSAFWLMAALFVLGIWANVGVYAMLPLFLQAEKGMGQTFTNFFLSASRILAMFTPFVAGWAAHRFGPVPVLSVIVFLSGLATVLLGLVHDSWLWLLLFLQPAIATAFFPPGYAIVSRIVPASSRNLIIAMVMPVAMLLGSGVMPTVIGAFGDAGRFYLGFIFTGGLIAVSTTLLRFVHVPPDKIPAKLRS